MKSILALDVSKTGCGFGFGSPDAQPVSGVEVLYREGWSDDRVFARGIVWLTQLMTVMRPEIVAIEAPIKSSGGGHTNPASQGMLLGLQGALRGVVYAKLGREADLIDVRTARKTVTGRGTYASGEAKRAVQVEIARRGWLSIEDMQADRADALCLWGHIAAEQLPSLKHSKAPKPSNVVHLIPPSERAF
jgi:Holliday junction resolvasome RuvABC endonuclease subunit